MGLFSSNPNKIKKQVEKDLEKIHRILQKAMPTAPTQLKPAPVIWIHDNLGELYQALDAMEASKGNYLKYMFFAKVATVAPEVAEGIWGFRIHEDGLLGGVLLVKVGKEYSERELEPRTMWHLIRWPDEKPARKGKTKLKVV